MQVISQEEIDAIMQELTGDEFPKIKPDLTEDDLKDLAGPEVDYEELYFKLLSRYVLAEHKIKKLKKKLKKLRKKGNKCSQAEK